MDVYVSTFFTINGTVNFGGLVKSYRVFLSTSEDCNNMDICNSLGRLLEDKCGIPREQIYRYDRDPSVKTIDEKVRSALNRSQFLICIFDSNYFESTWCFQELHHFINGGGSRDDIVAVISSQIGIYGDCIRSKAGWPGPIKPERVDSDRLNGNEREYLFNGWVDDLRYLVKNRTKVNFKDSAKDAPAAVEALTGFLDESGSTLIANAARWSAFCLGADRFRMGGWGYSLGQFAETDAVDGDHLPFGPYGMGIVGLRALQCFLTPDELEIEQRSLFERASGGKTTFVDRNPAKVVNDHLPPLSRYLALLGMKNIPPLFETYVRAADRALGGPRWTLEAQNSRSLEFLATAVASLIATARENNRWKEMVEQVLEAPRGASRLLDGNPTDQESCAAELCGQLAVSLQYYEDVRKKSAGLGSAADGLWRESSLAWLILSEEMRHISTLDTDAPAVQIRNKLCQASDDYDAIQREVASLVSSVSRDNDSASRIKLSAMIARAATSAIIDPKKAEDQVDILIEELFSLPEANEIVAKLDAIAWASVIKIGFAMYWQRELSEADARSIYLDSIIRDLQNSWLDGKEYRESRVQYLLKDHNRPNVQERNYYTYRLKLRTVEDQHLARISRRAAEAVGRDEPAEESAQSLKKLVEGASFQIGKSANSRPSNSSAVDDAGGSICGTLRVFAKDKRVEMDSIGYRKLFLEPFSIITGIDIENLAGVKREFGDQDQNLVELMANLVIEKTYALVDGRHEAEEFTNRTEFIHSELAAKQEDDGIGFEDLLKIVRVVPDREGVPKQIAGRFVHRTAVLQTFNAEEKENVVSWRFFEVSDEFAHVLLQVPSAENAGNTV